ncbi:hypothetical protein DFJ77DRAFT_446330 [Powellomyces hirtus]|nr:hypothetical protein DFJ77DRAFT_446330 [Powellomyces hirtus]
MWACVQCSYLNCNDSLACEVCYVTNVNANHMDVVWEWTPDNEVWIPYGKFTARKIEAAYRNDKQKITLRGGFFSTAPDAYHFRLDKENNVYYQVNLCSRKRRPARRRSAYDALVSVDIANIDPEDRCIMCQELCSTPFAQDSDAEDNDDADNDVVKLTGCGDGHYFHRDCIAGYLLLRASCPVCFTPIESS